MPSALSHYLLAKELLKTLDDPSLDERAFLCGAQGPDFFFIHRGFPWQKGESLQPLGRRIHWSAPSPFFAAMRRWLESFDDAPAARAYALGFLSHYTFDTCAHPYVYSLMKSWTEARPDHPARDAHIQIETALDTILLRHLWAQTPVEVPLKCTFPKLKGSAPVDISLMLSDCTAEVYGIEVDHIKILYAMNDFRLAMRLATDRTTLKKPFAEWLDRRRKNPDIRYASYIHAITEGDYDFANVLHEQWQNPYEEEPAAIHTEDYFALYHKAFSLSLLLFESFADKTADLSALTGEHSYETGLPAKPSDFHE